MSRSFWENFKIRRMIYVVLQLCLLFSIITSSSFAVNSNASGVPYTVVNGIVEDNNPVLGYITIYNPYYLNDDYSNFNQDIQIPDREDLLQTYNYIDPEEVEVFKNYVKAEIEDIEEGDTVFIKLDRDGYVISISGVSNYVVKYAKVIYKAANSLLVEDEEDKTQQVYSIDGNVIIFDGGMPAGLDALKDGDRIKLLLQKTPSYTRVKEIVIEDSQRSIVSNVYKAVISNIDFTSKKIKVKNLYVFDNGKWIRSSIKGITSFSMSNEYSLYYNGRQVSKGGYPKASALTGLEVYFAVGKDYGGTEQVRVISVKSGSGAEVIYDDTIVKHVAGSENFTIDKELKNIWYGQESIIIKNGRLVQANSITEEDAAYIVASRNSGGELTANVIQIYNKPVVEGLEIYRGRIKSINEYTDFTVESFSRLGSTGWEYSNTPKTFNITLDTRILDEEGLINQDNFTGYGEDSFLKKVVYIVADGLDAKIISTAPYGTYIVKGRIYKVSGGSIGEEGTIIEQPNEIHLVNTKVYDSAKRQWADSGEMNVEILKNSIILKDGKEIKPSELKKGDNIRILKKDKSAEGEAYIIIVEK